MISNCLICKQQFSLKGTSRKDQPPQRFCSKACWGKYNIGEINTSWKEKASYSALHHWIVRNKGKAISCSNKSCDGISKKYHWANISGLYKRDVDDFKSLCVKCHKLYDLRNRTHCKRGHELTTQNTYINPTKAARECKTCRHDANQRYFKRKKELQLSLMSH